MNTGYKSAKRGEFMKVRQATKDDFYQILALVNSTAQNIIEKDIFQWSYPCEVDEIEKQITNGEVFLLEDDNKLIGSYSIKPLDEQYPVHIENGLYLYRIMIHPFFHGKNMGDHIFKHLRSHYKKRDNIILDCWDGNDKLKEFYLRNGCTLMGEYIEGTYKISIFRVD